VAVETANPLVANGEKLMPSITRVFSRRRELYVFLHAYPRDRAVGQALVAALLRHGSRCLSKMTSTRDCIRGCSSVRENRSW
jgi:hypothetical protein